MPALECLLIRRVKGITELPETVGLLSQLQQLTIDDQDRGGENVKELEMLQEAFSIPPRWGPAPGRSQALHKYVDDTEDYLHEYVDDTEETTRLHEYVEDTEDYVNIQLDYRRNQLQGTQVGGADDVARMMTWQLIQATGMVLSMLIMTIAAFSINDTYCLGS
ncbi:unnamed protein product [Closterium sp. Naga37s-1]|nr:unnamed protein product [Closterium sp. Naga37s-1]